MINASLVKQLREKTGAGMMDCKKALLTTTGNFEDSINWLRQKGLSAAAAKADREVTEGLTAIEVNDTIGAIIEVNSETDFVARNHQFQNLVRTIAKLALLCTDLESLKVIKMPNGSSLTEEIVKNIATIGENLNLRRMNLLKLSEGVVGSYVHNSVAEGLGKISVLVAVESSSTNKIRLSEIARQIAIHIAANNPSSLDVHSLDPSIIQRERNIFFEQSKSSGKADNIIEKMVAGRMHKFFTEVVLLEQKFLFDDKLKISEVIDNVSKELGVAVQITQFIRYELGEAIEG